MQWIDDFQLFLFDFDGLLVDTEKIHFLAYKNMCFERGFELNWSFLDFCSIAHTSSDGLKEAIYQKFPDLLAMEPNWKVLHEEKTKEYFKLLQTSKIALMPGVEKLLTILKDKNKKCCVVTNSLKEQTDIIKKSIPVLNETISFWVTREEYERPKPFPDSYLRAIELYADKADKIIGFEDSLRGIEALVETPAIAMLICPSDHPQLESILPHGVIHYESMLQLPKEKL